MITVNLSTITLYLHVLVMQTYIFWLYNCGKYDVIANYVYCKDGQHKMTNCKQIDNEIIFVIIWRIGSEYSILVLQVQIIMKRKFQK